MRKLFSDQASYDQAFFEWDQALIRFREAVQYAWDKNVLVVATPHVSASAALMKSINPNLTAQQIKQIIEETTSAEISLNGITKTGGTLNTGKAVQIAKKLLN